MVMVRMYKYERDPLNSFLDTEETSSQLNEGNIGIIRKKDKEQ